MMDKELDKLMKVIVELAAMVDLEVAPEGRPAPHGREVIALIRRMAEENRTWGAPRVRDELGLLGHDVAASTVATCSSEGTSMAAICARASACAGASSRSAAASRLSAVA